jgi:glyoxylase-like metal-dependent hydrolase (beta-lactamase superfamily II)
MREVRPGVWHWEAMHPEWKQVVSSYAIDDGERLLLFDPLDPPAELHELVGQRETAVVLTCPWHHRGSEDRAAEWGIPLYRPPLEEGDDNPFPAKEFRAGDRLPVGVHAFPGLASNDLVLWVESHGAVVAGDTLVDRGEGLEVPRDWMSEGASPEEILAAMQPLLDLPVELVLATHGGPTDRAALERALSS